MCLAIPSKIVHMQNNMATIDVAGVQRRVSLLLLEAPRVGDWVLVHAGFAIQTIDESVARETLDVMRQAAILAEGDPQPDPTGGTGEA